MVTTVEWKAAYLSFSFNSQCKWIHTLNPEVGWFEEAERLCWTLPCLPFSSSGEWGMSICIKVCRFVTDVFVLLGHLWIFFFFLGFQADCVTVSRSAMLTVFPFFPHLPDAAARVGLQTRTRRYTVIYIQTAVREVRARWANRLGPALNPLLLWKSIFAVLTCMALCLALGWQKKTKKTKLPSFSDAFTANAISL